MALFVLASDKGSPGVTTSTVALAAVWPRRALIAECDAAGGDLVYRATADHGGVLNPSLGMISVAATARRGLEPAQLWEHVQRLNGGLEVITGIANSEQATGLAGLWPTLGRAFDGLPDADVFADCGRIGPDSPSIELMPHAAAVLLVARANAEQAAHVRDRALALANRLHGAQNTATSVGRPPIGVILIVNPKEGNRATAQVNELLRNAGSDSTVVGAIADDPEGAEQLSGRRRGRVDKSLLVRSIRQVAIDVQRRFGVVDAGRR